MPTTLRLPTATGSIRRRHFRNKPEISGFLWPPAQNQIDSFQLLLWNKHLVKNNRRPEQCMDPLSCYNLEGSTPLPILLKSLGYRDLVPCRPQQKAVPVPFALCCWCPTGLWKCLLTPPVWAFFWRATAAPPMCSTRCIPQTQLGRHWVTTGEEDGAPQHHYPAPVLWPAFKSF